MYTTIKTVWGRHKNKSIIARLTGHDWKTVVKAIKTIEEEVFWQEDWGQEWGKMIPTS